MWKILENPSVAAFLGAFSAFLLVALTDWRRRRRIKQLLTFLVSDNLDLARRKTETVQTNIDLVRQDNKITCAEIMRFPTQSIKDYQFQILDMLSANQKQGLEALVYWMEAIDRLLESATKEAGEVVDLAKINGPDDVRASKAKSYLSTLEEAKKNLGYLIELSEYYVSGKPEKIIEFMHPIGHAEIT